MPPRFTTPRDAHLLDGRTRLPLLLGAAGASLGVMYGYDTSAIAGARKFISGQFHLNTTAQQVLITAVVVGAVAGASAGAALANKIGRKKTLMLAATAYTVLALLAATASSMPVLIAARLLIGVTIGVSIVVVPVFLAESAPPAVRGSVLITYQVGCISGIIVGYFAAYWLFGTHNWRWMLGLAAVPAMMALPPLFKLPDTARFYMLTGQPERARVVLLAVDPTTAETEIAEIANALAESRTSALREMLRAPYLRATVFVVGLGFFVQITGINGIVYYGPRLLEEMGFAGDSTLLLMGLAQIVVLATAMTGLFLIDRVGRRPLVLTGIGLMIAANTALIAVFTAGGPRPGWAGAAAGYLGLLLFQVGFTIGLGAVCLVYAGESFPARMRAMGSGAMLTSNLVANVIVAAVFLTMLDELGGAGTFAMLGALALAGFAFVYRLAPETRGRQLEDIRHFWESHGRWPTETTPPVLRG